MVGHAHLLPLVLIAALSGCACEPEQVPLPVEVPGPTRYLPIPPDLLVCVTDEDAPQTNGDLLVSWKARGERLAECARSMEAISRLK